MTTKTLERPTQKVSGHAGTGRRSRKHVKVEKLPPGVPNPVDIHVGSRVRLRRTLLGMTQEHLGASVGLTFQQIQKYERGANRIGSSRLLQFGEILGVPVSFFFDELPNDIKTREGQFARALAEDPQEFEPDPLAKRETLELVRAYYRIPDPKARKRLFELIKAVAGSSDDDDAASE